MSCLLLGNKQINLLSLRVVITAILLFAHTQTTSAATHKFQQPNSSDSLPYSTILNCSLSNSDHYQLQLVEQSKSSAPDLETYTYSDNLFKLQVPTGAKVSDRSKPEKYIDLTWISHTFPYLNVRVAPKLVQDKSGEDLAQILDNQIYKKYGSEPGFSSDKKALGQNAARVFFNFQTTSGRVLGIARIIKNEHQLGIVQLLIPMSRAKDLKDQLLEIINSFSFETTQSNPAQEVLASSSCIITATRRYILV